MASEAPLDAEAVRARVLDILGEPAFAQVFDPPPEGGGGGAEGWTEPFLAFIAALSPLSLGIVVTLTLGVSIWIWRRGGRARQGGREGARSGGGIGGDRSPGQIRERGVEALQGGDLRGAISCFHRAAVAAVMGQGAGERAATNGEILTHLGGGAPQPFLRLMALQEEVVYGGRAPTGAEATRALGDLDALVVRQGEGGAP